MPIRASMLFELTTTRNAEDAPIERKAGWSESYWLNGEDIGAARLIFEGVNGPIDGRLRLLPRLSGVIIGARYEAFTLVGTTLVPGAAQPVPIGRAGTAPLLNDIPQMGLQLAFKLTDNQPGSIRHVLAGWPDASVVGGEAILSIDMKDRLRRFFLSVQSCGAVVIDRNQSKEKLLSISADGVGKRLDGGGYAVGTMLKISRARDPVGRRNYGGVYPVVAVTAGPTTFTLGGWSAAAGGPGVATVRGTVRPHVRLWKGFDVARAKLVRSVIRKVGRPFGDYRGRASKRRPE